LSLKLEKGIRLLTILSAFILVIVSTTTNSWAIERTDSQSINSENQSRSDTNVNNDIKTLNDDKGSSENKNESKRVTNPLKNLQNMGKTELSVVLEDLKVQGQPKITVLIQGQYDKPSTATPSHFVLNNTNAIVELTPGFYKVNIDVFLPGHVTKYYLSEDCDGQISLGQHKTCQIYIFQAPKLKVIFGGSGPVNTFEYSVYSKGSNTYLYEDYGNEQGITYNIDKSDSYDVRLWPYAKSIYFPSAECKVAPPESAKPYNCTTQLGICEIGPVDWAKTYECSVTIDSPPPIEKDTCHTEINEQGKPVKVC